MKKIHFFLFLLITTGINAQWKYCNLPDGGRIPAIIHTGNTLLAGTLDGIYWSTDNGNNWERANNTVKQGILVSKFALKGSTIFAVGNGIYKSIDEGKSWIVLKEKTSAHIQSLLISGDTIYAGSYKAIYRSVDNGTTWKSIPVTNTAGPISFFSFLFNGNTLMAATSGGLYASTDHGDSWQIAAGDYPEKYAVSLSRVGNALFAISPGNTYSSLNNGINWTLVNGLPVNYRHGAMLVTHDSIFISTGNGFYLSVDNGLHWNLTAKSPPGVMAFQAVLHAGNLFVATGYGVFVSSDYGTTWTERNKNIRGLQVWGMVQNTTSLFAATAFGVFGSDDEGHSWKNLFHGAPDSLYTRSECTSIAADGQTIYAGVFDGMIVSTDNGLSWKHSDKSLPLSWVNNILIFDNNIIAATDWGLFKSTNGISWTQVENPPAFSNLPIYCVAAQGNNLYAGTVTKGMYLSTDKGLSWTEINNGIPADSYICFILCNNTDIIAGTLQGDVYQSTDHGANWKSISSSVPSKTILMDPVGNDVFACTLDESLFVSTNKGNSWVDVQGGLPYSEVSRVLKRNNVLFASTLRSGIWYRDASEVPSGTTEQQPFASSSIYPNPSDGIFNIIPVSGNTTIEVSNLLGTTVLKTQVTTPSIVDMRGQPKGVYVVRIISGNGLVTNGKILIQ